MLNEPETTRGKLVAGLALTLTRRCSSQWCGAQTTPCGGQGLDKKKGRGEESCPAQS